MHRFQFYYLFITICRQIPLCHQLSLLTLYSFLIQLSYLLGTGELCSLQHAAHSHARPTVYSGSNNFALLITLVYLDILYFRIS